MTLDTAVSHLVFGGRLMERLLHDRGEWTLRWGDLVVPAERRFDAEGIEVRGRIPYHCFLGALPGVVELCLDGEAVYVAPVGSIGDGGFDLILRWDSLAADRQ